MDVTGPLPLHVARAYGVKAAPRVEPPSRPGPAVPPTRPLVAGRVDRAVDFDAAPDATAQPDTYQMYTRAADKVEAAVAVRVGHRIDVTG